MPKVILFREYLKKEFTIFRRYWTNSLGGMLTIYVIFLLIFGGYRGLASMAGLEDGGFEGLVVGYVLWFFMLSTYQDISYTLRLEAREGTLEQLYMSVHGFGWVMFAKVVASFTLNLFGVALQLAAAMLTTGVSLNLDLFSLLPTLVGTLMGILGVGFVIGGLTLIFKRIDSYTQMVQFLLIALVAVPADRVLLLSFLPGSYGAALLRRVMINGESLLQLGLGKVLFMFLIGLVHLAIGYAVYKLCERKAMIQGTLGHY